MRQHTDNDLLVEAVLESPDLFIGILDPDGTLRRANQTALDFADVTHDDVVGLPFWETPWWNHSKTLQHQLQSWIATAADGEYVRFEASHRASEGTEITVDGVLRPVIDNTGNVVSIIAEGRDVSEQNKQERQLAEQRERLEQLNRINETLRTVHHDLVQATDRAELEQSICDRLTDRGVYEGAWIGRHNPQAERIEPVAWSNIPDAHFNTIDIKTDESRLGSGPAGRAFASQQLQAVQDITDTEQPIPWRDQITTLDVRSIAAIPIIHKTDIYGIIGVWANRSQVFTADEKAALEGLGQSVGNAFNSLAMQSELERQNERLEQVTTFMSHDLRNLLNIATGRLDLARNDHSADHFDAVSTALDRMDALIDDLVTLVNESDELQDVEAISLDEVVRTWWTTIKTDDSSLVVDTEQVIRADRKRLRRLLENLFQNAIEHGRRDVTVRVGSLDTDNGFYVADDGPGIPADDYEAIFENGFTTSETGTGVGLAIVQAIVEAHGWGIEVSASAAGGARFEITDVEMVTDHE